jgi:penicillin-binding protein 1C
MLRRKITSGASTITMQVARMLQPKERTYFNKLIEIFRALQLEWHYSKNEIFRMYLNLLPYSSNIEGVKSASVIYFEQTPAALSLAQVVTLAIIPNSPSKCRIGMNNSYILQKRNQWLSFFGKHGLFPPEEIQDALNEPLTAYRHDVPKLAPHFCIRLKNQWYGKNIIRTYLDQQMQSKIETIALNYIKVLRNMNITNTAVMVINNKTNAIVAYLGSADFSDAQYQGQVDGVQAVRSPGSALKPYIYALAIDKGLITPKQVIADVPVNYGGYTPGNYEGRFNGQISMETALCQSLNVPAVKTLDKLGVDYFIDMLIRAKFKSIEKNKKNFGLSIALGGCGITLQELTTLYNAFANEGRYCPPKWTLNDSLARPDTLISAESAYMITQILTTLTRPDLPTKYENSIHLPKIAWKTGTSYGRRDAWSFGYNRNFTIGVWVGNFPGNGVPELSGTEYAVPLLFSIFNTIDYNSNKDWFTEPKGLDYRLVCSESGLLPSEFCTNLIMDTYIPTVSSNQRCQHLKTVFVSADGKYSYCKSCIPQLGYRKEIFPNLSPEIISFYEDEKIPYKKIPPHNPECSRVFDENAPKIISLTDGMEYLLFKGQKQQMMLRCIAENDVKKVYWYINNKFLSGCDINEKLFFTPSPGELKISCTDDKGRNSDIWIRVSFL